MHNRRARPTLRVLQEDLTSGWDSPLPLRLLADGDLAGLHPLSELPHPIIAKAVESFGAEPANDNFVGPIATSTRLRLLEIKNSQWRGGVWEDPDTGVRWLLVAGLAKGGHEDRDDFYKRVGRENETGDPSGWLPADDDVRLLKQETAARLRTEWELTVQRSVLDALRKVANGGRSRFHVAHPVPGKDELAQVDVSVEQVREDSYEADEVFVEIHPASRYAGSALLWQLTVRVLISLNPPEQGWDRFGDTFSNIAEPGAWPRRIVELTALVDAGDLAVSQPGSATHYTHREHLAGRTIDGEAVRALAASTSSPRRITMGSRPVPYVRNASPNSRSRQPASNSSGLRPQSRMDVCYRGRYNMRDTRYSLSGGIVKGGVILFRGTGAAACRYLESDRSRADDYYLEDGATLVVNTPKSLSVAAALHPDVSATLDAAQGDAVAEIRRFLAQHSVTRVGPRGRQEVVPVERLQTVAVVHKTSRAGDPHRHVHFQIGTRVWAAGKWRGLDTAALFKQQGAIRALGTAVLAAHPGLADALDAHGLTLDPVTGEVIELEPYNALMSKRGAQVERNLAAAEAAWEEAHPGQEPGPVVHARMVAEA